MMFPQAALERAAQALQLASAQAVRIATAETCTAGLVSGCITSVPGASKTFERGFVLYHDTAKATGLGVAEAISRQHGAVSAEVTKGLAEGALAYALEYARKREAFGSPIADLQAIQFMLADMAIAIEASRLLVYQAAWNVDQGMYQREHAHFLSIAKAFATETAVKVSSERSSVVPGRSTLPDAQPTPNRIPKSLPPG